MQRRKLKHVTTRIRRTKAEVAAYQRSRDTENAIEAARLVWDQERVQLLADKRELAARVTDLERRLIAIEATAETITRLAGGAAPRERDR